MSAPIRVFGRRQIDRPFPQCATPPGLHLKKCSRMLAYIHLRLQGVLNLILLEVKAAKSWLREACKAESDPGLPGMTLE